MSQDALFWVMAAIATFMGGASKGGLPMVGILAVPVLSLAISPVAAAGLLLPLYILSDIYGLWLYRHSYSLRIIYIVLPAAIVGILIGWATAHVTNPNMVKLIVGVIGLSYFVDLLLKARRAEVPPRPADIPRGLFWGTIAGFTSFVSHAGGPPYQMYVLPQKLDKMTFAGTSTILFTIINCLKVPPYWMLGQINLESLEKCIYLAPVAMLGAWSGYKFTKILPEKVFFRFVEVALIVVSLKLIWDGLGSYGLI
jgi:uncharacterized protein